jgi:DNA-binding SARP family transcriptional activator
VGLVRRIRLLDGFEVTVGGRAVRLPHRAEQLIALVAVRQGVSRRVVQAALWPDREDERAAASLRTELWRVHGRVAGLVRLSGDRLSVAPDVAVDTLEFAASARRLLDGTRADPYDDLAGPWSIPELLPGWTDEWLTVERDHLALLGHHACEAAARRLAALGRHGLALEAALASVRADPMRESAQRTLVDVHLAEGNVVEATRAYRSFAAKLRRELDLEPGFAIEGRRVAVPHRAATRDAKAIDGSTPSSRSTS